MASLSIAATRAAEAFASAPHVFGIPVILNLPAFLIVMAITWVLVVGIRESAWLTGALAVVNVAILIFFCVVGAFYVEPSNWVPFAPNGLKGISSAAAIIFFAYIGFDAVSTAAEETKNPQRDMPIAMIASLLISTVIYIAVAMVLTGMLPWRQLGTAEPLATAFSANHITWASGIIAFGAVCATSGVLLVFQLGQPRIFFSMARDGLLPQWAARVHPKYRTPHVTTILTGLVVAVCATFLNINEVVELTNIGTLFAFVLVAIGVLVLRRTNPDRARPFRTPFVPWVPLFAVIMCSYLMLQLPWVTWVRFAVWLGIGLLVYVMYGMRHSVLQKNAISRS
jgi:APA family basic amino acid/polyamine antiporter